MGRNKSSKYATKGGVKTPERVDKRSCQYSGSSPATKRRATGKTDDEETEVFLSNSVPRTTRQKQKISVRSKVVVPEKQRNKTVLMKEKDTDNLEFEITQNNNAVPSTVQEGQNSRSKAKIAHTHKQLEQDVQNESDDELIQKEVVVVSVTESEDDFLDSDEEGMNEDTLEVENITSNHVSDPVSNDEHQSQPWSGAANTNINVNDPILMKLVNDLVDQRLKKQNTTSEAQGQSNIMAMPIRGNQINNRQN